MQCSPAHHYECSKLEFPRGGPLSECSVPFRCGSSRKARVRILMCNVSEKIKDGMGAIEDRLLEDVFCGSDREKWRFNYVLERK